MSVTSWYFSQKATKISLSKFSSQYGNVIPGLERNRDGQISSLITHGSILIPHSWLSSRDEIKIPHLRLRRAWGIFISSLLQSHSWGIKIEPFVIREEIFFPVFVAAPLIQEKNHPHFSPDRVLHSHIERKT